MKKVSVQRGLTWWWKEKNIQRIPLSDVGQGLSPYPFLHILEQNENEALLIKYLQKKNIFIEWETEFIQLEQNESEAKAVLQKNNIREELTASWVVGADGGKSKLRNLLDLRFEGGTYENIFYVADTAVDWSIGYGELFLYIAKKNIYRFFPDERK